MDDALFDKCDSFSVDGYESLTHRFEQLLMINFSARDVNLMRWLMS